MGRTEEIGLACREKAKNTINKIHTATKRSRYWCPADSMFSMKLQYSVVASEILHRLPKQQQQEKASTNRDLFSGDKTLRSTIISINIA